MIWFYGISTKVGYFKPNPLYTYILDIYDLQRYFCGSGFLNELKLILSHSVKQFQVLLHITNKSIKDLTFVYTQLNDQTVLFHTIPFSISYLFALSLNVKQFYITALRVRVDMGAMAIKEGVRVVKWLSSLEMDTATRVQILAETDCISHSTNILGKGMNPIIFPPAMG